MPRCALPEHLKDKRHTDWVWPLSYIKRSFNAFGPRCEQGTKGFRPWPPTLVEGYGVSRWEMDGDGHSIIEIPSFSERKINEDVYDRVHDAIEKNPGHPGYDKWHRVRLIKGEGYSPSALQKFSKKGWMKLEPWYIAQWRHIKKVEDDEDLVFFHREGYRPDHQDIYYNWGPMLGLHFE